MNHEHITSLIAFNANLQLAHWQADTVTNEHRTLGDLYDRMTELTDDLAEVCLGKDGNRDFPPGEVIQLTVNAKLPILLGAGLSLLKDMRAELTAGDDDDLLNIIAEMSSAINKSRYLLKIP